jgi:hypothetical protein
MTRADDNVRGLLMQLSASIKETGFGIVGHNRLQRTAIAFNCFGGPLDTLGVTFQSEKHFYS